MTTTIHEYYFALKSCEMMDDRFFFVVVFFFLLSLLASGTLFAHKHEYFAGFLPELMMAGRTNNFLPGRAKRRKTAAAIPVY